jgi:hypothetical protein
MAGVRETSRRYIRCPFHDDKTPSAEIRQSSKTSAWYFYCHVDDLCLDYWALRARIEGVDVGELLKEAGEEDRVPAPRKTSSDPLTSPEPNVYKTFEHLLENYRSRYPAMKVEEVNQYTDPDTKAVDLITVRHRKTADGKKEFLQATPSGDGWVAKGLSGPLPLFNRIGIKQSSRVLFVEGEKCVRAIAELRIEDLAATTIPGGANSARRGDLSPLAGKTVYVWPDNDAPGAGWADTIIEGLTKLQPPSMIYRIDPNELGLAEKEDVYDYLQDVGDPAERIAALDLVLSTAAPQMLAQAAQTRITRIGSGHLRHIAFPHLLMLSKLTQAVTPEMVTLLVGDPGAAKSWTLLEANWRWGEEGESVRSLLLESSLEFWQFRALAQMSGYADVTDFNWVKENNALAQQLFTDHAERLERFSRNIDAVGSKLMKLDEVADWVELWARLGTRILIVDPITAAEVGDKSWKEEKQFMLRIKRVAEQTGCSIIIATHPRMGQAGKPSLSGAAGSMAYIRFSDYMFWLRHYDKPKEVTVGVGAAQSSMMIERALEIRKARSGPGAGKTIAVLLNKNNLCMDELGVVHGTIS